jgi:hypothetical protein
MARSRLPSNVPLQSSVASTGTLAAASCTPRRRRPVDGIVSNNQPPAWTQPDPNRMIEKILEQVKAHADEKKAADPRNLVFEYSPHVPESQAFVMPRRNFEDGRHRVFLHPSHREGIEQTIAALPESA